MHQLVTLLARQDLQASLPSAPFEFSQIYLVLLVGGLVKIPGAALLTVHD